MYKNLIENIIITERFENSKYRILRDCQDVVQWVIQPWWIPQATSYISHTHQTPLHICIGHFKLSKCHDTHQLHFRRRKKKQRGKKNIYKNEYIDEGISVIGWKQWSLNLKRLSVVQKKCCIFRHHCIKRFTVAPAWETN